MNIVYATDKNYAPICAASVVSLLENNKACDKIKIFLFADNLGSDEDKLKGIVDRYKREIEIIQSAPIVNGFKNMDVPKVSGSYSSYVRLAASENLSGISKFLYIDCDTLIFHNLEELYNTDISKYAAGAVCDGMTARCNLALGRNICDLYFNAGILLVNAEYWRSNNILAKMIYDLKKYRLDYTATGSDQEMINYTLHSKICKLPLKYNVLLQNRIFEPQRLQYMIEKNTQCYYAISEMQSAKDNPYICHFASSSLIRPWFSNSRDPLSEVWDYYLSLSGYEYKKQKFDISLWQKMCIYAIRILPKDLYAILKRYENRVKHFYFRKYGRI